MLDVHPPHHAVNSWRDFFIHIVTITIGLLIAIGLEQTVEYFHHRAQVSEMVDSLRAEGISNQAVVMADSKVIAVTVPAISAAIVSLQANGKGAIPQLPEINLEVPSNSAWSAARDIGLLALAPRALVEKGWAVYFAQDATMQQVRKAYADLDRLQALIRIHPDGASLAPASRETMLVAYADYRESLKVLKIDLDLLSGAINDAAWGA